MYEELIERLREYPDREESAGGYVEIDWQDLLDAADAIESQAQLYQIQKANAVKLCGVLSEKDKEIERLNGMLADSFQGHLLGVLQRKEAALSRVEAEREAARQDCAVAEENHCKAVEERDQMAGWVDLFCEMLEESFGRQTDETAGARAALAEIGWRGAQGEG